MNLRQLEAFRATIETGSITAASEALHVSQPSISRLIADLEKSVGFKLFLRQGRGLSATIEGKRFYQAVDSVFVGIDRLEELSDAIRTTAGSVVSVGCIPTFSQSIVPDAIATMYDQRNDVRFMLSTRNTPAIVDAVRLQQFDLGVVGRKPPYDGVHTLHQTAFEYVCLLPEHLPALNSSDPIDLYELAQTQSFITFGGAFPDEMSGIDGRLSKLLDQGSRISATNMPMAAALARASGAVAIVDPFTAGICQQLGGVKSCAIQQSLTYNVAIIAKGPTYLSREANELAKLLIDGLESFRK